MKKRTKAILLTFITYLFFAPFTLANAEVVRNEDGSFQLSNETLFSYGWSLTDAEFKETLNLLGVHQWDGSTDISKNNEENNGLFVFSVTGDDLVKYLPQMGFASSSGAWSSTYIVPNDNQGVRVEIVNPENITGFTAADYQSAAITAGLTNVDIFIGSARRVDGSGAMVGIYSALDRRLPPKNEDEAAKRSAAREVAQEELGVLQNITKANPDDQNFNDNLNKAVSDMKTDMIKQSDAGNKQLDQQTVSGIVTTALENNHIQNLVNETHQTQLTNLMLNFQASPAIQNRSMLDELAKVRDNLGAGVQNALSTIRQNAGNIDYSGFFGFFRRAWDGVTSFFSNLFN
jgi:uncharacterized protein YpuA (DUF1002 family)